MKILSLSRLLWIVGKQIHRSAQYLIYINSDGEKEQTKVKTRKVKTGEAKAAV